MSTKERILDALLNEPEALSGERLARRLGISRNTVWKAIEQLRAEGYAIEAVTNRGYKLTNAEGMLSAAAIRKDITAKEFGHSILIYDQLDSTNTEGKRLAAQGAAHGTLIIARAQSGGKGRLGRSFYSPPGSGIYISFLMRPKFAVDHAGMLTSCVAVAVSRAIERLAQVRVQIKWVNDLYIHNRKICGILCEAGLDFESGHLDYVVAGIGVNVGRMAFPEALQDIATSIGNETGEEISRNRLIAEICNCMEEVCADMDAGVVEECRARSNVIGKKITVIRGDERYSALALDIDRQGGLVVQTETDVRTLRSGEISIRFEVGQ